MYKISKKEKCIIDNKIIDEKNLKFNIIDSPMGTGKSTAIINYLKKATRFTNDTNERFIVFVPTTTEKERFIEETGAKTPKKTPFRESVLELIKNGENIVTTHALYDLFGEEFEMVLKEADYQYTAIFDETPSFFKNIVGASRLKKDDQSVIRWGNADVRLMQKENIIKLQDGKVEYNLDSEYEHYDSNNKAFHDIKKMTEQCDLYPHGHDKDGYFTSIIAFAKRSLFECFHEVWFCTYLSCGNMIDVYCHVNHIDMVYYHVENDKIVKNTNGEYKLYFPQGLERLEMLDDSYGMKESLSKEYFRKNTKAGKNIGIDFLKGRCRKAYEYMKGYGIKANTFIYTTFKEYSNVLKQRKVPNRFIPCNTKATNDYSSCIGVGYACNRFFDVSCTHFLSNLASQRQDERIKLNNDIYALSELIQFIWRSNIRVKDSNKKIYVWIPDKRMKGLLIDFIKGAVEVKTSVLHN